MAAGGRGCSVAGDGQSYRHDAVLAPRIDPSKRSIHRHSGHRHLFRLARGGV